MRASVGFTPVTGRMSPCLRYDFERFTVEAIEAHNLFGTPFVQLSGYVIGKHIMAQIDHQLPFMVESREQGIAWLSYCIEKSVGDYFEREGGKVPPWIEEGRRHKTLLPWERDMAAYNQRPHCSVRHDWAKLALKSLREELEATGDPKGVLFSFNGEVLAIRSCQKLVAAAPADGKRWQHSYVIAAFTFRGIPQRLRKGPIEFSIWQDALIIGDYRFEKAVPFTLGPVLNAAHTPMAVLFLHGKESKPGGTKPTYLAQHGLTVLNPALPDDDFTEAVRIAQAEFHRHKPDVVVGSSRGGAVAMNIDSCNARVVLLCPAWKKWGSATTVKAGTVILHSRDDDVIPFAESEELIRNSGLPSSALVEVGSDHRLSTAGPLAAMLDAVRGAVPPGKSCGASDSFIPTEYPSHFPPPHRPQS